MGLIKKFASVGGATMASRILGFVREMFIAGLLGTGPVADAFYAALRFPNLFRRLFAEGAFNAAFVPLFAKKLTESESDAKQFARDVFSVLILALLIISAFAIIFMPWLVGTIIAPKFAANQEKFDLTILLTRIMFPYLAAMSLVAMMAGILNSLRKYFIAALAPVILNIVLISALVLSMILEFPQQNTGIILAIAVTLSGILQLALLFWHTRQTGFLPTFQKPQLTSGVKRLLWLALPAAITGGIIHINLLVGQVIASAQEGAIAMINYADRLLQLPLGVIGIAIGVVLLPELARTLKSGQKNHSITLQNRSLEFAFLLTLPSTIGLAILAKPIIIVLFERGAFDRLATDKTSALLTIFALGLPAFVTVKIFTPSYYIRENMRWPMWCSLTSVIVNIGGSLSLFPIYGVMGIGIATTLSGWINALMLMIPLIYHKLYIPSLKTVKRIMAMCIASILMGGLLYSLISWHGVTFIEATFMIRFVLLFATIMFASLVYFTLVIVLTGLTKQELKSAFRR